MKKKVVAMALLTLLLLTSTAFATNWIFVKKVDQLGMTFYFDTDSAYKNSDTVTFWSLGIWDRVRSDGVKKGMIRYEATLSTPRYYRQIEGYLYDDKNNELQHDANLREWQRVSSTGSAIEKLIDFAFTYAK